MLWPDHDVPRVFGLERSILTYDPTFASSRAKRVVLVLQDQAKDRACLV